MAIPLSGQLGVGSLGAFRLGSIAIRSAFITRGRPRGSVAENVIAASMSGALVGATLTGSFPRAGISAGSARSTLGSTTPKGGVG